LKPLLLVTTFGTAAAAVAEAARVTVAAADVAARVAVPPAAGAVVAVAAVPPPRTDVGAALAPVLAAAPLALGAALEAVLGAADEAVVGVDAVPPQAARNAPTAEAEKPSTAARRKKLRRFSELCPSCVNDSRGSIAILRPSLIHPA